MTIQDFMWGILVLWFVTGMMVGYVFCDYGGHNRKNKR